MQCNCGKQNECGQVVGLHHIGVFTADMNKSIAFYETIGFEAYYRNMRPNGTEIAFVRAGSCIVELIAPKDGAGVAERKEGIVAHIAIAVRDIERLMCRLADQGVAFDAATPGSMPDLFERGSKNIFFTGPSGERLELFEQF